MMKIVWKQRVMPYIGIEFQYIATDTEEIHVRIAGLQAEI
jgi:hypothetical protein